MHSASILKPGGRRNLVGSWTHQGLKWYEGEKKQHTFCKMWSLVRRDRVLSERIGSELDDCGWQIQFRRSHKFLKEIVQRLADVDEKFEGESREQVLLAYLPSRLMKLHCIVRT